MAFPSGRGQASPMLRGGPPLPPLFMRGVPAELAAQHDQHVVVQPARRQTVEQCRDRLVDIGR